jgi:bifunctional DNA-binding transcriptional regulator/antitoxin component of YhaV-PrlF toxin-antitoxin module
LSAGIQNGRRFLTRRVHRAGASVQITIPAQIARAIGVGIGDEVRIYLVGQVMCVQRVDTGGFTPLVVPVSPALANRASGSGE